MCACGFSTVKPGETKCHDCQTDAARDADYATHGDGKPRHMADKVAPVRAANYGRSHTKGRRRG